MFGSLAFTSHYWVTNYCSIIILDHKSHPQIRALARERGPRKFMRVLLGLGNSGLKESESGDDFFGM